MNWGELRSFADRKSLEIIHFPEYGVAWPSRSLGGEPSGPDTPLLPGRLAPEPTRPAFVLPPGVTAFFPCRSLPPTPPPPWSLSSSYPPTDARYRPREFGYWHWVDDAKKVHVIYGPDTPLPLPPSYQHVHTMSAAEADIIAAASEVERRAATLAEATCALEGCSSLRYHDLLTGTSERCCSSAHEQAVAAMHERQLDRLITVFLSCPSQVRTNTPMSRVDVLECLTIRQFVEEVRTTLLREELLQWPRAGTPRWQIRLMPGNTVVADTESTRLFPPTADMSGPDETLSTAGIVHHSVVAISRISLPTAYYGVRCANGFSAVFSNWEGARPSIEGHHVVHGKFKTEHQAAVLAFHGINLRTSPNTSYPPDVPEIVLDAAPADYRKRPRHAPSVVNQSAPVEQISSHTSGFRGDAECSTVSERVNRSAQTGCRSDLFVSVPHTPVGCPRGLPER